MTEKKPAVAAASIESTVELTLVAASIVKSLPPHRTTRKPPDLTLVDLRGDVLKQTPITLGNHLTESGNADRLAAAIIGEFLHCPTHNRWYSWTSKYWKPDDTGRITTRAKSIVDAIYAEAMVDKERRADVLRHAKHSSTARSIKAMIGLAACHPDLVVLPNELNQHPFRLNVRNGTLDLETGSLLEHSRSDLITHHIPVEYNPDAACPTWLAFLDRVFAGNDDLIDFIQRAAGYSLTADTREQCLFFLYGHGRNGKTTFLNVLIELMASYSIRTPTETLMVRRGDSIPNDVARLDGPRLVLASEVSDGQRLNESRVKDLTGGDRISARFMRAEYFDFTPVFKLWMAGNHKPRITGTDDGIWRRIRLVPFTVTIPQGEVDDQLPAKLRSELPGILRWATDGCLDWIGSGLDVPEAVTNATGEYRREMDVIGEFLSQCCLTGRDYKVKAGDLYSAYSAWCGDSGYTPMNMMNFGRSIAEREFSKEKTRSGYFYLEIGLKL